ncbi:MAG: sigma 54-interacting transcriptional regulator [Candidatus Latescibacterota bacterium]
MASTDVLLLGETGTAKGLAARSIHDLSVCCRRSLGPGQLNCGAIPQGLGESHRVIPGPKGAAIRLEMSPDTPPRRIARMGVGPEVGATSVPGDRNRSRRLTPLSPST